LAVSHLPGPEQAKGGRMPGKDRFWLDDGQRRGPVLPEAGQADPHRRSAEVNFKCFAADLRSPAMGWRRARFWSSRAARDGKIERTDARSAVRKMGMSEDYEGCVTPIRSDISPFSRGTDAFDGCFFDVFVPQRFP
jgi:hypothetical protein